jgi:hypothetical protein
MTKAMIQGSFRGAGLIPWDPNSVITRLNVKPRTPTPEVGGLPTTYL